MFIHIQVDNKDLLDVTVSSKNELLLTNYRLTWMEFSPFIFLLICWINVLFIFKGRFKQKCWNYLEFPRKKSSIYNFLYPLYFLKRCSFVVESLNCLGATSCLLSCLLPFLLHEIYIIFLRYHFILKGFGWSCHINT